MRLILLFLLFLCSLTTSAADDYEKALLAFEENKIQEAYIHLKNVLKHHPDNLPAQILMGKALLKQEYYSDGIDLFREALSQGADINLLLNDLGHALIITKQYEQVIDLGKGRLLSKEGQLIWLLLSGNAHSLLNEFSSARDAFEKALAIDSKDIRTLSSFASFQLNQNNVSSARKLIDKLIEFYPHDSRVWNLNGQYFDKISDQAEALIAYEEAYRLNAKDPIVQRKLAHAYTSTGQYTKALIIINQVLIDTPLDPYAQLLKSQLLTYSNRTDESESILRDISEKLSRLTADQKHSNISLVYVAGTVAYFQGKFELAQKELLIYIKERPEDLSGIKILTDIYLKQGQIENAIDLLESKSNSIYSDLHLSLILVELYLNKNKLFKADGIISELEKNYNIHPKLITVRSSWLAKNSRYDEALTLLNRNRTKTFDASYTLAKGLIYRDQGKLIEAIKLANILLDSDPMNSDFLAFRGALYIQQKQWKRAILTFDKILISKPNDFASLFNIATASAALQNYQKARKFISKLTALQPNQVELKILIAKLERDTGSIIKAIKLFEDIVKTSKTNVQAIEALQLIYFSRGDFNAALIESDKLTKIVFLNPKYIKQKAKIYLALNKQEEARKQLGILQEIVKLPSELYELSQLQLQLNDFSNAKQSIVKALYLEPKSIFLRLALTNIEMTLGNIELASTQLKNIEKEHKNNPNVLMMQGNLFMKKKDYLLAQRKYHLALTIDNHFGSALARLYELTEHNIGGDEFNILVGSILEKYPNKHFMRNLYADYLLNRGDFQKAKLHYERLSSVKNFSNKGFIFNNLAYISIKSDLENAEKYAKKALDLNGSSASIIDTYGWVLSLRGNYNEGLKILRKAFAMNSNNPSISYHLAYTLNKLGRIEEAKQELMKATGSTHRFSERKDAKILLQQLSQ